MSTRPLADATLAATMLLSQIVNQCAIAEHGTEDRKKKHERIGHAIELAEELRTRLECARDLFAAQPQKDRT